ncbi:MAG: hypothetical protein IPK83_08565 [Planctomycetes bacterium]|nr:hypothetical protein [Planctomycetota bacterium]
MCELTSELQIASDPGMVRLIGLWSRIDEHACAIAAAGLAPFSERRGPPRASEAQLAFDDQPFLLPVMFFGAENIAQASHDAIEYRAVEAAVAAAQAADVPPSSPTGITIHPCHKVSG